MVYQPPVGARDLLPLDVSQKRWIEDRLQQVFHRWGYHRIITSTLERLDTLMAGEAIQRSTVLRVHDQDEELGLRPELTASIARTVVTRMAGATYPLRLYYDANVFRRSQEHSHNRQQEFYQSGVELLGHGGLLADVEVLLLLTDALHSLGLQQWSLVLGEAGLTRSFLSPFPVALQPKIRHAIATLDRVTLETLPLSPELRDRALTLFDLRGNPAEVLDKATRLDLDASQQASLENLRALVQLLTSASATVPTLILDLSLVQTIDYYTGIVFEVVSTPSGNGTEAPGGLQILGQGGRYDQLLGLYHPQGQAIPGIGFALQIEHLHQVLSGTGQLPPKTPAVDWIVVPETPQAYPHALRHAQQLRSTAGELLRVELNLGDRTPVEIQDYARHRRIGAIAWVADNGDIKVESLSPPSA